MTKNVTDEQLGVLARRQNELFRRVREGTLPVEQVLAWMQRLIEGDFGVSPYRGNLPTGDLPPDHNRLPVSYTLPSMEELEAKFSGEGSVSGLFDGREWERHSFCAKIDETPGEREFCVLDVPADFLGKRIKDVWNELATFFDKLGHRFAIETEAISFADAHPDLQRKNWILALGSSTLGDGDRRYVAMLGALDRDRVLDGYWVDGVLYRGYRLLLVRKASSAL